MLCRFASAPCSPFAVLLSGERRLVTVTVKRSDQALQTKVTSTIWKPDMSEQIVLPPVCMGAMTLHLCLSPRPSPEVRMDPRASPGWCRQQQGWEDARSLPAGHGWWRKHAGRSSCSWEEDVQEKEELSRAAVRWEKMRGKARGAQAWWSAELQGPHDGSMGHSKSNASCRRQTVHGLIKTLLLTGGWLLTKIIAALWSTSTWNVSDVTAFKGRLLTCQAISTSLSSCRDQHLHLPFVKPTDTP